MFIKNENNIKEILTELVKRGFAEEDQIKDFIKSNPNVVKIRLNDDLGNSIWNDNSCDLTNYTDEEMKDLSKSDGYYTFQDSFDKHYTLEEFKKTPIKVLKRYKFNPPIVIGNIYHTPNYSFLRIISEKECIDMKTNTKIKMSYEDFDDPYFLMGNYYILIKRPKIKITPSDLKELF